MGQASMMSTNYFGAKMETIDALGDKLSPFVRHLFHGEHRVIMPDIGNEKFNDNKFFVVTKEYIYCPYVLPAVEHEIAHAVEMNDRSRWLLPDWGLAVKPFNHEERLTASMVFAAMSREIRVRAIQLRMVSEDKMNRYNSIAGDNNTLLNILNNQHAWGAWAKRFTPFGRFHNETEVRAWADDLREKTYKAWSLERIEHEWKIRLAHMQNWMETKEEAA